MSTKRKRHIKKLTFALAPVVLIALLVIPALSMGWNEASPPELSSCTSCHDDATLIEGKHTAWEDTLHGSGESRAYAGGRNGCAGCHSGGTFSSLMAAGHNPGENSATKAPGDPNATPQDCRACHQIHETGTGTDWGLESNAAVSMYHVPGATFDGGSGNLCVNCHQPRSGAPVVNGEGNIVVNSVRFYPHYGAQSSMMLGVGANTAGSPATHYSGIADTCVTCHMGSTDNHSWTPNVSTCKTCHTTATNFDINGSRTAVQGKIDALKAKLLAAGMLNCTLDEEGHEHCASVGSTSAPSTYTAAQGNALWNWMFVVNGDQSVGVHNPAYTNALLDEGLAAMP